MKNSNLPGSRPLIPALPVATTRPRRPQARKGWFTVQLPARDLKLMRKMAREAGTRFDLLMRGALADAVETMRAEHTLARCWLAPGTRPANIGSSGSTTRQPRRPDRGR